MRRRRKLPPDTRPRWNDLPDHTTTLLHGKLVEVKYSDISKAARNNIYDDRSVRKPVWHKDPTYNLRKK